MKRFLLLVLVFICALGRAGDNFRWEKGSVVNNQGEVLAGEVAFVTNELILHRQEGKVMVYNPHQIKGFSFHDSEVDATRNYGSINVEENDGAQFFEILLAGKIEMVRIPRNKGPRVGRSVNEMDYTYWIKENEKFMKLENFKRDVYPGLVQQAPMLETLVRIKHLNTSYITDIVNIVSIYNYLDEHPYQVIAQLD